MSDVTLIPLAELVDDLAASEFDLRACEKLLPLVPYLGYRYCLLQERIEGNLQIILFIRAELARREGGQGEQVDSKDSERA